MPISLTPQALHDIVQTALPDHSNLAAIQLKGGFANTLYRLVSPTSSYVLRIYTRSSAIAETEVALLRFLQGRVPVSELIYADTEGEAFRVRFQVSRFVEGVLLEDLLKTVGESGVGAIGRSVGQTLADISAMTFASSGFFAPDLEPVPFPQAGGEGFSSMVREMLFAGRAGTALGGGVSERLRELVQRDAPLLETVAGARSLVHSDFNPKNIIMRKEALGWTVAAVIDWEFAFSNTSLIDIGNMLRFSEDTPEGFDEAFVNGFKEHGGDLPDNWRKLSSLCDLVALLDLLTRDPGNPFFERARKLILQSVERGWI